MPGQQLTDEQWAFVHDNALSFLIVNGDRGVPIGYPMTLTSTASTLEFSTYRKSAKVAHVERDDRVCVVVVPRSDDDRTLRVWGRAAVADGWSGPISRASGREVPAEIRSKVADRMATGKRVVIRVTPSGAAW